MRAFIPAAGSNEIPKTIGSLVRVVGTMGVCVSSIAGIAAAHADTADTATTDPGDSAATNGKLEPVVVKGVRPLLDDKLPGDLQNTPQTITVVSSELMEAQASTRLEDALKNVPGITLNAGEGAARGDTVNLRGFSAFNDFFLDGIRDAAVYTRDSFNLESVEVVKGPSATLFGRGSTGGAINQVSKAPTLAPVDSVTLDFGTNHEYRATTDIDVPLSSTAAFRVNAMGESSEVADRNYVKNRRWGLAPSLAFGIGEDDSLTLAFLHQQENNLPDSGIPFVDGRPAPVPRGAFYGLASDHQTTNDNIGTVRYKHDFNPNISVADTLRFAHYEFNYQSAMPNFGTTVPGPGTPLTDIVVGRDAPGSSGTQTDLTNQTDLTARFTTGAVSHTLFTGIELGRQTNDLSRYNNPFNSNNNWVPETPLLSPDATELLPGVQPITSQQNTTAHSAAVYATDTLGITPYLDFVAGVRFDNFSAGYAQYSRTTGAVLNLAHTDNVTSPRAALIFKPTPQQSYYVSFGTSFDPSAEALTLTTKTADLGPVKAKSYEVGTKTSWLDGMFNTTAALFHTEVDNAQTNDPDNPTLTILNGDQRVEGVELGINGYLTKHLEVIAGYTYLDGKTLSSGTAAYVGQALPNVARNAMNLWTEYELTDAWEVGLGGNWLGARFADSGQTATIPGYVVFNAMSSYKLSKTVSLQLNLFNLANKLYYDSAYYTSAAENHVLPGAGRTAKLTIRTAF
jgi:catecholate siderophore receptor